MKLVKDENKSIKTDLKSAYESRTKHSNVLSEIRQTINRLIDDRSNGVANIKGDIKQMRSEFKVFDGANQLQIESLTERISEIQKLDKRVKNLESKVNYKKCAEGPYVKSRDRNEPTTHFEQSHLPVHKEITLHETERSSQLKRFLTRPGRNTLAPTLLGLVTRISCTRINDKGTVSLLGPRYQIF